MQTCCSGFLPKSKKSDLKKKEILTGGVFFNRLLRLPNLVDSKSQKFVPLCKALGPKVKQAACHWHPNLTLQIWCQVNSN